MLEAFGHSGSSAMQNLSQLPSRDRLWSVLSLRLITSYPLLLLFTSCADAPVLCSFRSSNGLTNIVDITILYLQAIAFLFCQVLLLAQCLKISQKPKKPGIAYGKQGGWR